jgi:hypothetical protein
MHSHSSNERIAYNVPFPVTIDMCREIWQSGTLKVTASDTYEVKTGTKTSIRIRRAGSVGSDGTCYQGSFTDWTGEHNGVVVQDELSLLTYEDEGEYDIVSQRLIFQSITMSSKGAAEDARLGVLIHEIPEISCTEGMPEEIYKGKLTNFTIDSKTLLITEGEAQGVVEITGKTSRCGMPLYSTSDKRMYYYPTVDLHLKKSKGHYPLATFMDMQLKYTFYYGQLSLEERAASLLNEICRVERNTLLTMVAILRSGAQVLDLLPFAGPGKDMVVAGEVAHIRECAAVDVTLIDTPTCYTMDPVVYKNKSMFVTPHTKILRATAEEVTCMRSSPDLYEYDGIWKAHRSVLPITPPQVLKPQTHKDWEDGLKTWISSGFMGPDDYKEFVDRSEHGYVKEAISSAIAQFVGQRDREGAYGDATQIIERYKKETAAAVGEAWGSFKGAWITFGINSGAILGIIGIIASLKGAISGLINLRSLYQTFGWSINLCACLLTSWSAYLLRRRDQGTQSSPSPRRQSAEASSDAAEAGTSYSAETTDTSYVPLLRPPPELVPLRSMYPEMPEK